MNEEVFRGSLALVSGLLTTIRLLYGWQAHKAGGRVIARRASRGRTMLLYLLGGAAALVSALYVVVPKRVQWAALPLPIWARWLGVAFGGVTVLLASRVVLKIDHDTTISLSESPDQLNVILEKGTVHVFVGERPLAAGNVCVQDPQVRAETGKGVFLASYNPESKQGYYACEHASLTVQSGDGTFQVNRRQLQLVVDIEMIDQKEGKTVWQRQGLSVLGDYNEGQELEGRRVALQKLTNEIVDGAQSQW